MDIRKLLEAVAAGNTAIPDALKQLENLPYEDIGFAKLDHHRALRRGFGEVIFGAGKTIEQLTQTFGRFAAQNSNVLTTRVPQGRHR